MGFSINLLENSLTCKIIYLKWGMWDSRIILMNFMWPDLEKHSVISTVSPSNKGQPYSVFNLIMSSNMKSRRQRFELPETNGCNNLVVYNGGKKFCSEITEASNHHAVTLTFFFSLLFSFLFSPVLSFIFILFSVSAS